MKSAFSNTATRMALALALLTLPGSVRALEPQTSPPMDQKAMERASRDARKAAEGEEKALRAAVARELKQALESVKTRDKAEARLVAMERETQASGAAVAPPSLEAPQSSEALTKEQQRLQKAEEKARAEAEKARLKEEARAQEQERKDAERRRKDEERAEKEAAKAREKEEKARAEALRKESENAEKGLTPVFADPTAGAVEAAPVLSKEDEKRRKELIKQIEKARETRDKLNQKAEEEERTAEAARSAANEAQRLYEALNAGLEVEEVVLPEPPPAPADAEPKKSRFVTMADKKEAEEVKNAPVAPRADPLRLALDLKSPIAENREKAAFALADLGPEAEPATRALMGALADAAPTVRVASAQALGRIGPAAALAVTPLTAALTDPDPAVRNAAQAALLAIQGR